MVTSDVSDQTSAILFTLIEACRSRNLDPWEYLRDVLTCLPSLTTSQLDEVMPDAWLKARTSESGTAARSIASQRQAAA